MKIQVAKPNAFIWMRSLRASPQRFARFYLNIFMFLLLSLKKITVTAFEVTHHACLIA